MPRLEHAARLRISRHQLAVHRGDGGASHTIAPYRGFASRAGRVRLLLPSSHRGGRGEALVCAVRDPVRQCPRRRLCGRPGGVGGTVLVPIIKAMQMSLYNHVLIKPQEYGFVGLANYARLFHDDVFWLSLWNSFLWVFGSVSFQFLGGFAAALLLHQAFRGRSLVRTLTLLPWIIPGVVVALIWEFLYQPNYGALNDILTRLGWMTDKVAWLSNPYLAMPAVIATNVWRGVPFFAIMLLAGLQAVPDALYEAAGGSEARPSVVPNRFASRYVSGS